MKKVLTFAISFVLFASTLASHIQAQAAEHTVKECDTWYSISKTYGISTEALASANGRTPNDVIKIDEKLYIPNSVAHSNNTSSNQYKVQANDTWYSIATRYGTTSDALASANGRSTNDYIKVGEYLNIPASVGQSSDSSTPTSARTHLVQKNQTWRSIAAKYGVSPYDLAKANGRKVEDLVYTGETLLIPTSSSVNTDVVHSFSVTLCTSTGTNSWYNIQLAAETLDGMTLNPGQSFSWHSYMGWCNKDKGYKESTIYMNGEVSKASGGGICFVSTTLMQAARGAGCVITEKHDHSLPVKYAGRGNEAAVSWGGKNLRFYNPSSTTTLKFSVSTNGNTGACTITCAPV